MKHWDLTPKQAVTLVRQDGHRIEAWFLFRDTVRACFLVLDDEQVGQFRQFQLTEEGHLKDSPTREQLFSAAGKTASTIGGEFGAPENFAAALQRCKRWTIWPE